jgi:malonate transporter and related proteins
MSYAVFHTLLAIFLTVAVGYISARLRWFGEVTPTTARTLGDWAFNVFIAALLFRTTAHLDLARMPWHAVAAYYLPALGVAALVYGWQRYRAAALPPRPALPATRAVAGSFGNTVQLGIPMAAALFGEAGLALHITLLSVHVLIILSVFTVLAEVDLARAQAARLGPQPLWPVLRSTLGGVFLHPVMLPVLAGLLWHSTALGLHPVVDETLVMLGAAAVPMCLVLIGVSLQAYGMSGQLTKALPSVLCKLLLLPAAVLVVAHWGFGFQGTPLAVMVMMAAAPVGSNALLFAQRYETLEAEATASIVISTLAFAGTAWLWLALLAALNL